jgi:hypothetical protein
MGQMEMKCISYFYVGQGYSGEHVAHGPLVDLVVNFVLRIKLQGMTLIS